MRFHGIFLTILISSAIGLPPLSTPSGAATLAEKDPPKRRGAEIAQSFLDGHGDNISVVTTGHGTSCIASRNLPISASSYIGPFGADVSFTDVTRSPATSIQAIARPDAPVTFRIQLKYSPDRSRPVELHIGNRVFDLASALEASSDSVLVDGEVAGVLAKTLRRDAGPILRATSEDTGRVVEDRIVAPDMVALDACLDTVKTRQMQDRSDESAGSVIAPGFDEPDTNSDPNVFLVNDLVREATNAVTVASEIAPQEPAEAGHSGITTPEPVREMRVDFVARPDPATRISPNELQNCRMRDIPEEVFLGRLTGVSGFFSQTRDVYVAFDDDGQVHRAYIPGIFDADLTSGRGRARASLAADYNLPDRPNTVKGCLGDAPIDAHVCVISTRGDDHYSLVECGVPDLFGALEDFVPPVLESGLIGDTDIVGMPFAYRVSSGGSVGAFPSERATFVRLSSVSPGKTASGLVPGRIPFPQFFGRSGVPRTNSQPPVATELGGDIGESDTSQSDDRSEVPVISNSDSEPVDTPISIDGGSEPIFGNATVSVASMPLPATLWMLIGSLGAFFLLRASGRRKRSSQTL